MTALRCLRCDAPLPVPPDLAVDTVVVCRAQVRPRVFWTEPGGSLHTSTTSMPPPCSTKHIIRPGPGGVNVLEIYEEAKP